MPHNTELGPILATFTTIRRKLKGMLIKVPSEGWQKLLVYWVTACDNLTLKPKGVRENLRRVTSSSYSSGQTINCTMDET